MQYYFFHRSLEPMPFFELNDPDALKPPFLEDANNRITPTFKGEILLQDRSEEFYGISLRHFNYRKEADLRVAEAAPCMRLEYLYEGSAHVRNGEDRPKLLEAGSYLFTRDPEYQFRSSKISGARVLVFYLPHLEKRIPDCDSLADGKVYFSNAEMRSIVSALFQHDCGNTALTMHYEVAGKLLVAEHSTQLQNGYQAQTSGNARQYQQLQTILDTIHADLSAKHTIDSLCMVAGVNRNLVTKLFRKGFQTTFLDYLHHYRMEMVKYLGSHEGKTLVELASLTGFSSDAHLCRAFIKNVDPDGYLAWCQRNKGTYVIQYLYQQTEANPTEPRQ